MISRRGGGPGQRGRPPHVVPRCSGCPGAAAGKCLGKIFTATLERMTCQSLTLSMVGVAIGGQYCATYFPGNKQKRRQYPCNRVVTSCKRVKRWEKVTDFGGVSPKKKRCRGKGKMVCAFWACTVGMKSGVERIKMRRLLMEINVI